MDSPQSVVSPFKGSSVFAEPEKQKADLFGRNPGYLESAIDVLEVYIHQARDIHNICIYQKQDVYAKICLTSDPEITVSTQTINGGGKNPVFNEKLRLNVRTIDSSLKCEIWMLSRVKNYLEDQLLGFALVPMSEVLIKNGKLEKEFSLSSTDLFHSPAGFVQLSLCYNGASPEVMALPAPPAAVAENAVIQDSEVTDSLSNEFDKIEFPDPNIANENQMMVSEYFGIPCTNLDSQSSESFVSADTENQPSSEIVVQGFSTGTIESIQIPNHDSPPSSVSTNGSPSASLPASSQSCDTPGASKSPNQEAISALKGHLKEKREDSGDAESNASDGVTVDTFVKPVVTVNIEPEQKVVQQEEELEAAKKELASIREESFQFMASMDVVRNELKHVCQETARLKKTEEKADRTVQNLNSKLLRSKAKLEAVSAAEEKAKTIVTNLFLTVKQLKTEAEAAKKERELVCEETINVKAEVQKTESQIDLAEERLQAAMQELEAVKSSEAIALENLKALTENTMTARASASQHRSTITISNFEYEYLAGRAVGAEEIADKKVAAAQAWIEALKASEKEILMKTEMTKRKIKELKVEEKQETYKTEKSLSAKRVVEGELQNWKEKREKSSDPENLQLEGALARKSMKENGSLTPARRAKFRKSASPAIRAHMVRSGSFTVRRRRKVMPNLAKFFNRKSTKEDR